MADLLLFFSETFKGQSCPVNGDCVAAVAEHNPDLSALECAWTPQRVFLKDHSPTATALGPAHLEQVTKVFPFAKTISLRPFSHVGSLDLARGPSAFCRAAPDLLTAARQEADCGRFDRAAALILLKELSALTSDQETQLRQDVLGVPGVGLKVSVEDQISALQAALQKALNPLPKKPPAAHE